MKRLLALLFLPLMAVAAGAATASTAALPAPHQVVEKATREVLDRIVRDRPLFQKNPDHLYTIVEQNLVPYVDFQLIARRVMAKYYLRASDDQRRRFAEVFKTSLIRAYGSGLSGYDGRQKFVVLPPGAGDVQPAGNGLPARATVNMNATLSDGAVYPVTYALFQDAQGQWKLENLVLDGINLGLTYRNNFADLANQYGGDIDKVIANWNSRVETQRKQEQAAGK